MKHAASTITPPPNPEGIRSVTMILIYEDSELDTSFTFEADEILADGSPIVAVPPPAMDSLYPLVHVEFNALPARWREPLWR